MSEKAYQDGLRAFDEYFEGELAAKPDETWRSAGRANAKEDANWWRTNGKKMVWSYYQFRKGNPNLEIWHTPEGVPGIELEINLEIASGVMMKAFVDRVMQDKNTGDLLIVDLKTGKTTPTSALQLATYRMVLQDQFGISPRYGAYWMGREGKLDSIHDLDRYPVELVRQWFTDVREQIVKNSFIPSVSRDCSWCGMRDNCFTQNKSLPTPFIRPIVSTVVED